MPFLFLSPSTQQYNPYVTSGNEEYWMNRLADYMTPYLEFSGINVRRNDPDSTVGAAVRASNAYGSDFHLALHSNALPQSDMGRVRGIDVYYYPTSAGGKRMAEIIANNLKDIYPLPARVRALSSTKLYEIRSTSAPSVLLELGYHDNEEDALWVENNLDAIARTLSLSITEYFGLPLLSPHPVRSGTVTMEFGNLNLRDAPSATAGILLRIPNGATVTILNTYNGWYVVEFDGVFGWASNQYIR
ncbi:MAG: N-acetylmuramoyl-L-alanine amidase [Oscillospiraceae bacterium]|jgi:N-acetylmuramoyl-L-alanine amidase|nr:N-acetylmuramoyl-L-alanine amidase [Oscillospiraceae bacterium]